MVKMPTYTTIKFWHQIGKTVLQSIVLLLSRSHASILRKRKQHQIMWVAKIINYFTICTETTVNHLARSPRFSKVASSRNTSTYSRTVRQKARHFFCKGYNTNADQFSTQTQKNTVKITQVCLSHSLFELKGMKFYLTQGCQTHCI